ncbi:hypothetical protein CWI38_0226p0040 [Hamiltosporidium tvaerminnensis]|uniref:Uncharacterized protein n=1 Tax=Hamiltosporidium tvaerminnensis TaxID=1176355 RepID=A0A4Q9LZB8_9MICR|nr:hypothetical protein CWI38_0226p0040 [Hamiltosporidium tvaerminnensis]
MLVCYLSAKRTNDIFFKKYVAFKSETRNVELIKIIDLTDEISLDLYPISNKDFIGPYSFIRNAEKLQSDILGEMIAFTMNIDFDVVKMIENIVIFGFPDIFSFKKVTNLYEKYKPNIFAKIGFYLMRRNIEIGFLYKFYSTLKNIRIQDDQVCNVLFRKKHFLSVEFRISKIEQKDLPRSETPVESKIDFDLREWRNFILFLLISEFSTDFSITDEEFVDRVSLTCRKDNVEQFSKRIDSIITYLGFCFPGITETLQFIQNKKKENEEQNKKDNYKNTYYILTNQTNTYLNHLINDVIIANRFKIEQFFQNIDIGIKLIIDNIIRSFEFPQRDAIAKILLPIGNISFITDTRANNMITFVKICLEFICQVYKCEGIDLDTRLKIISDFLIKRIQEEISKDNDIFLEFISFINSHRNLISNETFNHLFLGLIIDLRVYKNFTKILKWKYTKHFEKP